MTVENIIVFVLEIANKFIQTFSNLGEILHKDNQFFRSAAKIGIAILSRFEFTPLIAWVLCLKPVIGVPGTKSQIMWVIQPLTKPLSACPP